VTSAGSSLSAPPGTARNAPCRCGSGRRYKACCGAFASAGRTLDDAVALYNAANAQARAGRLAEAVEGWAQALRLRPALLAAQENLAGALLELGRMEAAVAAYRRLMALQPNVAAHRVDLGQALRALGRVDEAIAEYAAALRLEPNLAAAYVHLGVALRLQGRTAEAKRTLDHALALDPRSTIAALAAAECHADLGDFAGAEGAFKRVLEIDPDSPEAWAAFPRLKQMGPGDSAWVLATERIAARSLPPRREAILRYAIGKYWDDLGDYEKAFAAFERANALDRDGSMPFDRSGFDAQISAIIAGSGRERFTSAPPDGPVFIVGMLRSGTTLAEQILAAHPDVQGVGELGFWGEAAARRAPSPKGETYLQIIRHRAPGAKRVVDKMPANYLHLGLILTALPAARIIHMVRDPRDTCLSIYFQHFEATLDYANDLDDLAHCWRGYARLMDHWRAVLPPGVLMEVPYEGLVADPDTWSRRMTDFIGLAWDARCLDFHRASRTVITASKWQVRQPITTGAVGRWRRYRPFLGPLAALDKPVADHSAVRCEAIIPD